MKNKSQSISLDKSLLNDNKHVSLASNEHLLELKSLKSDPVINNLYLTFSTQHSTFINSYANWIVSEYAYEHEFIKLKGLLDDLTCLKFNHWESRIQDIFSRRTKKYKDIFSGVNKPVSNGNPSEMLNNIKLLSQNMKKYKKLFLIRKDINNFINIIHKSLTIVQEKADDSTKALLSLEASRKKVVEQIFNNYSLLNNKLSPDKSSLQVSE